MSRSAGRALLSEAGSAAACAAAGGLRYPRGVQARAASRGLMLAGDAGARVGDRLVHDSAAGPAGSSAKSRRCASCGADAALDACRLNL